MAQRSEGVDHLHREAAVHFGAQPGTVTPLFSVGTGFYTYPEHTPSMNQNVLYYERRALSQKKGSFLRL